MSEPKVVHEWDSTGRPGPPVRWAVTGGGGFHADHGGGFQFINITQPSIELARLATALAAKEAECERLEQAQFDAGATLGELGEENATLRRRAERLRLDLSGYQAEVQRLSQIIEEAGIEGVFDTPEDHRRRADA